MGGQQAGRQNAQCSKNPWCGLKTREVATPSLSIKIYKNECVIPGNGGVIFPVHSRFQYMMGTLSSLVYSFGPLDQSAFSLMYIDVGSPDCG